MPPQSTPYRPRHGQPGALAAATPMRCGLAGVLALGILVVLAALPDARRAAAAPADPRPVAATVAARAADSPVEPAAGFGGAAVAQQRPGSLPASSPATAPTAAPPGLVASALAADGIPMTALAAYQSAAQREALLDPACHLDWSLLAAIGRVESDHGRFAGAVLYTDGLSYPPIIGIPLDGVGTALIRDTDHGRLDGDTVYDRAVGPMQFIPSTWARWGVDADGDGRADPFDIFDAAAAAADYLCASGADLATTAGQERAVYSYNHDDTYVRDVVALAATYAAGLPARQVVILPDRPAPATSASPSGSAGASGARPTPGSSPPATSPSGSPATASTSASSSASTSASSSASGSPPTAPPASGSGSPSPTDSPCPTPTPDPSSTAPPTPAPPSPTGAGCATPSGSPSPSDTTPGDPAPPTDAPPTPQPS